MTRVVIPFSGGYDSTILLWLHALEGHLIFPFFVKYGQESWKHELEAAKAVLSSPEIVNKVSAMMCRELDLRGVSDAPVLGGKHASHLAGNQKQYVPGRNAYIGLAAMTYAISVDAHYVDFAFVKTPSDRFGHSDTTASFASKLTELAPLCFDYRSRSELARIPEVRAPLVRHYKSYLLRLASAMNIPIGLCRTCYKRSKTPCNECPSCLAIKKAREEAAAMPKLTQRQIDSTFNSLA